MVLGKLRYNDYEGCNNDRWSKKSKENLKNYAVGHL